MIHLTVWMGILVAGAWADTPANCTFEDIAGKWVFYEGARTHTSTLNCTNFGTPVKRIRVDLRYPNIAIDEFGNSGHWTLIYNQGFQVTVNQRTYFGFSYFTKNSGNTTSYCDKTFPSKSHDVLLRQWACFYGRKKATADPKVHQDPFHQVAQANERLTREMLTDMVERINSMQSSWQAQVYESHIGRTHEEVLRRSGGKRSWLPNRVQHAPASDKLKQAIRTLPPEFDWRNVDGTNFVSPVRDQGTCGSCYAFSSMGMLEARLRVQTNNTLQIQLSPEDILSCSQLAQGCDGGFPFLIAGKYAKEYGVVNEACNPYREGSGVCKRNCTKHYTASYGYVGGYYGACNEELMMLELLHGGPLSVSFEVYDDFHSYKGGIYHHTGITQFNPFEITNHAVLLVGYGQNETTGEKYWIVKNSWGEGWGENGYFRIRRGTDECGIESLAVHATPIP